MRIKLIMALAILLTASSLSLQRSSAAKPRSLFVVADSIVLGAATEIPASMPAGWNVVVDAKVSRSTTAGLDVVRAQRGSIGDTLVIGLGANDGGSPAVFGPRVEALLAEVADVPHVYWIEIAEVRNYYPGANQVVREAAGRYDNVSVIEWSALALANPSLTTSDGLHLTGNGRQAMAAAIVGAVTAGPTRVLPTRRSIDLRHRRRGLVGFLLKAIRQCEDRTNVSSRNSCRVNGRRLLPW